MGEDLQIEPVHAVPGIDPQPFPAAPVRPLRRDRLDPPDVLPEKLPLHPQRKLQDQALLRIPDAGAADHEQEDQAGPAAHRREPYGKPLGRIAFRNFLKRIAARGEQNCQIQQQDRDPQNGQHVIFSPVPQNAAARLVTGPRPVIFRGLFGTLLLEDRAEQLVIHHTGVRREDLCSVRQIQADRAVKAAADPPDLVPAERPGRLERTLHLNFLAAEIYALSRHQIAAENGEQQDQHCRRCAQNPHGPRVLRRAVQKIQNAENQHESNRHRSQRVQHVSPPRRLAQDDHPIGNAVDLPPVPARDKVNDARRQGQDRCECQSVHAPASPFDGCFRSAGVSIPYHRSTREDAVLTGGNAPALRRAFAAVLTENRESGPPRWERPAFCGDADIFTRRPWPGWPRIPGPAPASGPRRSGRRRGRGRWPRPDTYCCRR